VNGNDTGTINPQAPVKLETAPQRVMMGPLLIFRQGRETNYCWVGGAVGGRGGQLSTNGGPLFLSFRLSFKIEREGGEAV
jgi:hypothetical protein